MAVNPENSWLIISTEPTDEKKRLLAIKDLVENGRLILDDRIVRPKGGLHPVFQDVTIDHPIEFAADRRFEYGVSFKNVVFKREVDFSDVEFHGPAYFWGCTFEKTFSLAEARVRKNSAAIYHRDPGEVNFSYCHFQQRVDCSRAAFDGPGYLHRTIFFQGASFADAKFNQKFLFEGLESDICIPKDELKQQITNATDEALSRKLIAYMEQTDINRGGIKQDCILFRCVHHSLYHYFDPTILSTRGLRDRLAGFSDPSHSHEIQRAIDAVCQCWNGRYLHTMFADSFLNTRKNTEYGDVSADDFSKHKEVDENNKDRLTDFRNASFCKETAFRNVDLSYCLFSGSNVSDLEFIVSHWARQLCNPKLKIVRTRRCALRDELELDRKRMLYKKSHGKLPPDEFTHLRRELSELYRELRLAYIKEGDTLIGRDFYFGEMEMERLSKKGSRRILSLGFAYKVFAGYSRQSGLALLWLLVLLGSFALLYFGIARREDPLLQNARQAPNPLMSNPRQALTPGVIIPGIDECVFRAQAIEDIGLADRAILGESWWRQTAFGVQNSLQASTFFFNNSDSSPLRRAEEDVDASCGRSEKFETVIQSPPVRIPLIAWATVRRVLEGLERLLVLAQIALIFICLRARFQRIN